MFLAFYSTPKCCFKVSTCEAPAYTWSPGFPTTSPECPPPSYPSPCWTAEYLMGVCSTPLPSTPSTRLSPHTWPTTTSTAPLSSRSSPRARRLQTAELHGWARTKRVSWGRTTTIITITNTSTTSRAGVILTHNRRPPPTLGFRSVGGPAPSAAAAVRPLTRDCWTMLHPLQLWTII